MPAVQASNCVRGQAFTIRSSGASASTACSHPLRKPLQLTGGMGVGVDRDQAAELQGLAQQGLGRVASFGAGVDLHGGAGAGTGGEDELGIEPGLGPTLAHQLATGAVPKDVGMGLSTAATMRFVMGPGSMESFECTLATTMSSRASSVSSWSRLRPPGCRPRCR